MDRQRDDLRRRFDLTQGIAQFFTYWGVGRELFNKII